MWINLISVSFCNRYMIITILSQIAQLVSSQQDICYQSAVRGRCFGYIPRWYFDAHSQNCYPFNYGGCGGNNNNFDSEEECLSRCLRRPYVRFMNSETEILKLVDQDVCEQAMEHGTCKGYFQNWFYDHDSAKCKRFVYTGCGGTGNNFRTKEDCLEKCGRHSHSRLVLKPNNYLFTDEGQPFPSEDYGEEPREHIKYLSNSIPKGSSSKSKCHLPPDGGFCKAIIERWYYNWQRERCMLFTFGGCRGNKNNFLTEEDCMKNCS